jgi:hypothetical protein
VAQRRAGRRRHRLAALSISRTARNPTLAPRAKGKSLLPLPAGEGRTSTKRGELGVGNPVLVSFTSRSIAGLVGGELRRCAAWWRQRGLPRTARAGKSSRQAPRAFETSGSGLALGASLRRAGLLGAACHDGLGSVKHRAFPLKAAAAAGCPVLVIQGTARWHPGAPGSSWHSLHGPYRCSR